MPQDIVESLNSYFSSVHQSKMNLPLLFDENDKFMIDIGEIDYALQWRSYGRFE